MVGIDFGTTRTVVAQRDAVLLDIPSPLIDGTPLKRALGKDPLRHVAALRDFLAGLPRDQAVAVATPACVSPAWRMATVDAFTAAGFTVEKVMSEPAAAALEYAGRYAKTLNSKRQKVVVFDLGGGTFDASRVSLGQGGHVVELTVGDPVLGGHDFDLVLSALTGQDVETCRLAKEALVPNSQKVLGIPVEEFYEATRALVDRAVALTETLWSEDCAGVYVTGGASSLPSVARALRERFGRRVKRAPNPTAATALGLARPEQTPAETVLGVYREWDGGRQVSFDPLLDPTQTTRTRRYRAAHNIGHYRWVRAERVDQGRPEGDLQPAGELRVAFDPGLRGADLTEVPVRPWAGPEVEERYRVVDGRVHVEVEDLESGYRVSGRL